MMKCQDISAVNLTKIRKDGKLLRPQSYMLTNNATDHSLCCPTEDDLDPWLPTECPAKTQADLSLRWTHMQYCRKCCLPAHKVLKYKRELWTDYALGRLLRVLDAGICYKPISGSIVYNRFKGSPWGCCPRDYHWPMKSNRAFVRNPDNGYLQPRYSCHCHVWTGSALFA